MSLACQRAIVQEVFPVYSQLASHADYADETFTGLHLAHARLTGSTFADCTFGGCYFMEVVWSDCRFTGCTFRACDLSLAQLPGTGFSATRFEDCRLLGIDWTRAAWPRAISGPPIGFWGSVISHSTFIGLSLPRLQLKDCTALDVDFREADLSQADFGGTDLAQSLFGGTNLTRADLSQARNYQIDPGRNSLKQARFSLPEALSLLYSLDIVLLDS